MRQDFDTLCNRLQQFSAARDWAQFHSPKNLACALTVEAAELLEIFQWMTEAESRNLAPEKVATVESELADILSYLIHMANQMKIDLVAAGFRKLELNESRYPIDKARGKSTKYSDL